MTTTLSDLQQQAVEHAERARSEGMPLSQYLRTRGIGLRPIYDAIAAARRKGVAVNGRLTVVAKRRRSPFVAVHVAEPITVPRGSMVCRVLIGGATVIECGEWPPAAWLSSLSGPHADAAP